MHEQLSEMSDRRNELVSQNKVCRLPSFMRFEEVTNLHGDDLRQFKKG